MYILGCGVDVRKLAINSVSFMKRKRVEDSAHFLQRFVEFDPSFVRRFLLVYTCTRLKFGTAMDEQLAYCHAEGCVVATASHDNQAAALLRSRYFPHILKEIKLLGLISTEFRTNTAS